VFNSPQLARTIGRVFDTAEGHPAPRAGRVTVRRRRPTPRCQSSTAPFRDAGADLGAVSVGVRVEASCYVMRPSNHAGAAASFASRTAMQIAVSRQSGGAGSGGKPDKAGADF
jgi:hypothetical protein